MKLYWQNLYIQLVTYDCLEKLLHETDISDLAVVYHLHL